MRLLMLHLQHVHIYLDYLCSHLWVNFMFNISQFQVCCYVSVFLSFMTWLFLAPKGTGYLVSASIGASIMHPIDNFVNIITIFSTLFNTNIIQTHFFFKIENQLKKILKNNYHFYLVKIQRKKYFQQIIPDLIRLIYPTNVRKIPIYISSPLFGSSKLGHLNFTELSIDQENLITMSIRWCIGNAAVRTIYTHLGYSNKFQLKSASAQNLDIFLKIIPGYQVVQRNLLLKMFGISRAAIK